MRLVKNNLNVQCFCCETLFGFLFLFVRKLFVFYSHESQNISFLHYLCYKHIFKFVPICSFFYFYFLYFFFFSKKHSSLRVSSVNDNSCVYTETIKCFRLPKTPGIISVINVKTESTEKYCVSVI